MSERAMNYKCPNCTGPLRFDEKLGKVKCDYCESTFTVEEIEELYAQRQQEAEEAAQKTEESRWDTSEMKEDWGEDGDGMVVYNCPSCGAEMICQETAASMSCPYCGNPSILPGQFRGALKPDYVIPFKVDKEKAIASLKEYYKGRILLPSSFGRENHLQEIKGIYVPFWLFDGEADADVLFHTTRSHVHREGNYEVTTTEHFNVRRAGKVAFEKIPVDASSRMPDAYMDSIEPFDYGELKEFSTAYMPGFLADKYDMAVTECSGRADERAAETAYRAMENSVMGYMTRVCVQKNISVKRGAVRYAMLPVWLLNTQWKGKSFLFAINGQTGKMVGDLPISRGRLAALFTVLTTALTALLTAIIIGWGGV